MSIQAIAWVLDSSRSKGHARLVLIALANHANGETGECWPSQRTIAQEAGVSPGSVPAQIRKLIDLEELVILEPGGRRHSARYRLPFAGLCAQELSTGDPVGSSGAEHSARPRAEHSARPRAEQNRHRTVSEPEDPPSTPPPAREWAEKWCQLVGVPATRSVLRKWVPQVQDFMSNGGRPSELLLERARAQGIETPAGWSWVAAKLTDPDRVRQAEEWMAAG